MLLPNDGVFERGASEAVLDRHELDRVVTHADEKGAHTDATFRCRKVKCASAVVIDDVDWNAAVDNRTGTVYIALRCRYEKPLCCSIETDVV